MEVPFRPVLYKREVTIEAQEELGELAKSRCSEDAHVPRGRVTDDATRWLDDDAVPYFGLSFDQYQRYRQTGIYGAYRVMFRRIQGLTRQGDGFRPDRPCRDLIDLIDADVPKVHLPKRQRRRLPDPVRYWAEAWPAWHQLRKGRLFPTVRDSLKRLSQRERAVLCPQIFGANPDAQRRRQVAVIVGGSRAARHSDLCDLVARKLKTDSGGEELKVLPDFSRLADAGVDAMDATWGELSGEPHCQVRGASGRVAGVLDRLADASKSWTKLDVHRLAGEAVVRRFAAAICDARSDQERLLALVQHHEQYGGGLGWFKLARNRTQLVRVAPERPTETSRYRFRLYSLARLAVQCGVITDLPPALGYSLGEEE